MACLDDCAGDGLHVGRQFQAGELMDEAVERLAQLGYSNELPQLLGCEVVVTLPSQVLLLHAAQDLCGDALELPQRRLQIAKFGLHLKYCDSGGV